MAAFDTTADYDAFVSNTANFHATPKRPRGGDSSHSSDHNTELIRTTTLCDDEGAVIASSTTTTFQPQAIARSDRHGNRKRRRTGCRDVKEFQVLDRIGEGAYG
jgi:hypothetical protein